MAAQARSALQFAVSMAAFLSLSAGFGGCWNPGESGLKLGASPLAETKPCVYANPVSCPAEEVCTYTSAAKSECIARYAGSTPFVRFPFEPEHPVICSQGIRTPMSAGTPASHSWAANQYALDLDSPRSEASGRIYAAIDGSVLVSLSDQSDLGRHVRILAPNGVMVLYAHLEKISVQEGQPIRAGDPIGLEGDSGKAGKRHLLFSVHYVDVHDYLQSLSYYRGHPDEVPPSIPFETQFCDPARPRECKRVRTRVENVPCGSDSTSYLRADWRS